jgi:hypothetical protein
MTSASHAGMALSEIELDALLRRLNLANMRRVYRQVVCSAEQEQWSYRDFLALLVAEEVSHRTQTRLQRLTRRARFPYLKTIEDFDFTLQSTLRISLLGSYLGPDFRHRRPIADPSRKDRPGEDPSRDRNRISRNSTRFRDPVRYRGPADRGPLQCRQKGKTA